MERGREGGRDKEMGKGLDKKKVKTCFNMFNGTTSHNFSLGSILIWDRYLIVFL